MNWLQIKTEYYPIVKNLKTEKELANLMREIIKKINDGHIKIEFPQSLSQADKNNVGTSTKSKAEIIDDLKSTYLQKIKTYNNGLVNWGFLKNRNIGYIVITDMNNFAPYVTDEKLGTADFRKQYEAIKDQKTPLELFSDELQGVDQLMNVIEDDFKNTKSIVVDLRFNGGGYETVALKLLSYFVSKRQKVLSVMAKTKIGFSNKQSYWLDPASNGNDKKVFLLVSPNTASAAEIFALASLRYSNIKRIGSPTAGIFSEMLWKKLPNEWEFSLSNEIYLDYRSKGYEGIGIPVNYNLHYPRNRYDFYSNFYKSGKFVDEALEKLFSLTN